MSLVETTHERHRTRRAAWESRAVDDTGIDLRRPRAGFVVRSVPAPSRTLRHKPLPLPFPPLPVLIAPPTQPAEPVRRPDLPYNSPLRDEVARCAYVARQVIRHVAAYYKTRRHELTGPSRTHAAIRPRFISICLTKNITGASLNMVGAQFGKRDHTSILNALRKTRARARADFQFASELAALECLIRRHL